MDKLNIQKDKQLLLDALNKAKKARELPDFVDDLFTEEEILDLAQRLKIAKLILEGKTYDEIAEKNKYQHLNCFQNRPNTQIWQGGLAKNILEVSPVVN